MKVSQSSFGAFYQGQYGQYIRGYLAFGKGDAALLELAQPRGDYPDEATPDFVLQMALKPTRLKARVGHVRIEKKFETGALYLLPPDTPTSITLDDNNAFLVLAVPKDRLVHLLGGRSGFTIFEPFHKDLFHDDLVKALLLRLWSVAGSGAAGATSLFAEAGIVTLFEPLKEFE